MFGDGVFGEMESFGDILSAAISGLVHMFWSRRNRLRRPHGRR
jgi:hypothetical protein